MPKARKEHTKQLCKIPEEGGYVSGIERWPGVKQKDKGEEQSRKVKTLASYMVERFHFGF